MTDEDVLIHCVLNFRILAKRDNKINYSPFSPIGYDFGVEALSQAAFLKLSQEAKYLPGNARIETWS